MKRVLSDPGAGLLPASFALIVAGFFAIAVTWRSVARQTLVSIQIPYMVSGGLGALGLILTGAGLAYIQTGRQVRADERASLERLRDEGEALLDTLTSR